MILKVFRDRPDYDGVGWLFIDGVKEAQVDPACWLVAREKSTEEAGEQETEHRAPYGIFRQTTNEDTNGIGRGSRLTDYRILFEADRLVKPFSMRQRKRVIVITVLYKNGETDQFVRLEEGSSSWLLNDEGKTIERL